MDLKDLLPTVITIIMIGLILGIGIYIVAEVGNNMSQDQIGNDNNVNITDTLTTNETTLSDASLDNYELKSIGSVVNESNVEIPSGFYSFTTTGVVTWNDTIAANDTAYYDQGDTVNITSTYTYDTEAENAINTTTDGLVDFAGWIPVIVVVIAAAIVLGIVLRSFGERRITA